MSDEDDLLKIDREITQTENAIRTVKEDYERTVNPQFATGNHRSIWTAPPEYFDPYIEAGKILGVLTARRRMLRMKMNWKGN
jgi:hypothetical protein